MKKIFTLALSLLFIIAPRIVLGQNELTVHDGTIINGYVPIYGYYTDAYLKAEMVYPAAELTQMAGGNISGLTFYASEDSLDWGTTFQVFLTEVVDATISSFVGSGTVVYEGSLVIENNELVVEFTTPFQYGGGNLLVGVYQTDKGSYATTHWYGETVTGASVQGHSYNSLDVINATQRNFLPKTTFSYTPAGSVTCPKPMQFAVSNVTDHSAELSWVSNASSWQICLNGDESSLISVSTNHYTLTGLTAETYNTVKVRSNCAGNTSAWSTIIGFWATDNKIIGSGTATSNEIPSHSYYRYALTQQIYTAQEIGTPCTINSIAFYNADSGKTRNYDMYLVLTDKTSFANSTDWIPVTSSDRVFSGEVTMAANQWTVFDIDDFLYDGTSNLALIMDDNTGTYTSSPHMACRVFAAPEMTLRKYSDGTDYDPVHPEGYSGTVMDMKNQIMMDITPISGNVCFRPATLSVNNITAHSATVSWSGGSGVYNVEYKRTADEDWIVYAHGTTGLNFTMTNLTQATEYQVQVQSVCSNGVSVWKSTIFTSGVVSTDHLYVTENGQGEGESWSTATNDLQSAVNTALAIRNAYGITPDVWVAAGTYYGDISADNAFTMVEGVNVYGGFAGNEPANYDLSLRNFGTNTTILDGQNTRRVLNQLSDFGTQTIWDGFTIQNGQISGSGGGVYLRRNGRLSHCRIEGNTASYDGGGVYCNNNSVVENCEIVGNTSGDDGGGMYAYNSTVFNCIITKNTSNYYGGGLYAGYGVVRNCLVSNNTSRYGGGGIYSYNNSQINNTVVRNSSGSEGAGVYASYNASLTNCILWGNERNSEPNNIGGTPIVAHSAVEGGCEGDSIIVLNEINSPLFVNPSMIAGANVSTSNWNWCLQNGSVCVNRGNNAAVNDSLDLDGTARIKRDTVDLGCYESNYYSVPVQYCSTVYGEFYDTVCNRYTWNEQTYTWSGNYSQSFELPDGCDSVVTLHLVVKHAVTIHDYVTICESDLPYTYRDTTFETGTPVSSIVDFPLSSADVCDSILTLHLTVLPTTLEEFGAMTPTNNYPVTSLPIRFTWDAVENASSYDLYLWPVGESQPQQPTASNILRTQYTIAELPNRQDYQWLLTAHNACGSSASPVRQFSLNVAPSLAVSASNPIDFGEVSLNSTSSVYFQVNGTALDNAITYQLSGADVSAFTLAPTNTWDSMSGGRMQLTFHPQTAQNEYTAQLTLQSNDIVRTYTVKGYLAGFLTFTTYVDSNVYAMDSEIPVHGRVINALNEPAEGLDVEVYVKVMEYVRTYPATTDANGQFTVTFTPQHSEAGYYTVGSRMAGGNSVEVHDDFNIPGMMLASSDWILWEPTTEQADSGVVVVRNRSQIPLTNIQVTPVSLPNGCSVQFAPLSISGQSTGQLQYVVSGSQVSTGSNYEEARLSAVSDEGAALNFSAWYYCMPQRADLDVMPGSITTTMNRGTSKVVDFKIYNNGTGPTGTIRVSLPDMPWMSVVGGDTLPSLAVHDSSFVSIRLSADSSTALIRYTGNIAINCDRGEGVSIPYSITAISDSTGSLVVDVTDEYTWNTNNGHGPHLAGANVMVKGYYSLETVAVGVTDSNGLFTVNDLAEGWYKLIVRAESHEEYQNNIYITAGETNQQDIFIQFQAITYSWEVVPTEIEDEYTYELNVVFETHVPKPVVVLDMPENIPALEEGESYTFDFILTNHGLVATYDVQLFAPESSMYTFTPLYDRLDSLPAQTTQIIPCVMTRPAQTRSGEYSSSDGTCPHRVTTRVLSYYLCAGNQNPIWALSSRNVGTEPCYNYPAEIIPTYNVSMGTYSVTSDYSTPVSTPLVQCECEDELLFKDTTVVYGMETTQLIICEYYQNCLTEEITYSCDTVLENTDCSIRVSTQSLKVNMWNVDPSNTTTKTVEMNGVAADGKSELKIYVSSHCNLSPDEAFCIPSRFGMVSQESAYLGEILGIVNKDKSGNANDTVLEITYRAPSTFPLDEDKEYTVNLQIFVPVGDTAYTEIFQVSVIRPPLLLIHGLNSDASCFNALYDKLKPLYSEWQMKKVDYQSSNTVSFSMNQNVVRDNLFKIFKMYNLNGYVVSKADLVGHSMGGILARLHVEYVNNENVHKVITVNTPHAGAHVANFVMGNPYVKNLARAVFWKWDVGAVNDLQVTSSAIREYLNNSSKLGRMNNIPVHAVVSTVTEDAPAILDEETKNTVVFYLKLCAKYCPNETMRSIAQNALSMGDIMGAAANSVFCGLNTFIYNFFFREGSDYVVPLRSQKGGLPDENVSLFVDDISKAMHTTIQSFDPSMQVVMDLLKAPTTDTRFSMNGFHPDTLGYPASGPEKSYLPCINIPVTASSTSPLQGSSNQLRSGDTRDGESNIQVTTNYDAATRTITAICSHSDDVEDMFIMARFSDGNVLLGFKDTTDILIPATYKGNVDVFAIGETATGNVVEDSVAVQVNQYGTTPQSICFTNDTLFMLEQDTVTPMMKCAWTSGDTTYVKPAFQANGSVLSVANEAVVALHGGTTELAAQFEGLTATIPVIVYGSIIEEDTTGTSGGGNDSLTHSGVCASVTVQFSQRMTMTREAFEGTLTINNGHASLPMQDIDIDFVIKDEGGQDCTNLFQINFLAFNNMTGTNGSASLNAQNTGSIVVQFIPTKYAAPEIAKQYSFGGSFSFIDPFSGESMTYNLYPVDITVHPSPDLYVNYFMQRDILGDDPLTEDRVEPVVPAELGVIIHNRGAGVAKNVLLETAEPKIIDNDKGLAVDFAMYGAAFNGSERQLGLMEIPFGDIQPHQAGVGEWWFTSTLLGHFISYEAHVIHNNSFGNPDLSLVSSLRIHPLVHTVYAYGNLDDGINDFLVDDVEDNQNYPDSLYFSNGSRTGVATADSISFDHYVTPTDTIVTLTLDPSRIGWNYGQTWDPSQGSYQLISCTRNSDQQVIPLSNVWQTFVTLPVGADPIYENKLHIVDTLGNDLPTTYTLVFSLHERLLEVDTVLNVPDTVVTSPLTEVTVIFNKPIVDSSFNYLDMSLKRNNGANLLNANLVVEKLDSMTYKLHLGDYTQRSGLFVLNIQTTNILDMNGSNGFYGKEVHWIQDVGDCEPDSVFITDIGCDSYVWNGITYTASGDYTLVLTNAAGCDSVVTLHLNIVGPPQMQEIIGEKEVCINQFATYSYDISDQNFQYKWFKDNALWAEDVAQVTLHEMNAGTVLLTMQVADAQLRCVTDTSLLVQVMNRVAPDTTEIRRRGNTNMLVCQPVSSNYGEVHYRWGYTDIGTSAEVVIPGDHNYCMYDFGIDTLMFRYWVETYLNNLTGEGCANRSYYGYGILTSSSEYDVNAVEAYMVDGKIVLHVSAMSHESVFATLYDVNGKLLLTKKYGETDMVSDMIPVSYAPGVYILRVNVGNQLYSFKLLKL